MDSQVNALSNLPDDLLCIDGSTECGNLSKVIKFSQSKTSVARNCGSLKVGCTEEEFQICECGLMNVIGGAKRF